MRSSEIQQQLANLLPRLTDKLTTDVPVGALTRSGSVVTAACNAQHGLEGGDVVTIVGAVEVITISSLTRSGTVGTLVTASDHDLTNAVAPTITISGATEAEFNGTFTLLNVDNRRTITFSMVDSGPTTATGSPVLEGAESLLRRYDGIYEVRETPSPSTFTFENTATTLANPIGVITARTKPRIATAATAERMMNAYTAQPSDGRLWMFVVLEDVPSSKDRSVLSDAQSNFTRGTEFRQQIIQPFTLYLIVPVSNDAGGSSGRDQAEDLFRPICRSLLFRGFDSGLFVGTQGLVQFVTHGTFGYDGAVYVHAYSFQQVVDLVFEDTVEADLDVALRTVDMTQDPNLGTNQVTAVLNLDDTPL